MTRRCHDLLDLRPMSDSPKTILQKQETNESLLTVILELSHARSLDEIMEIMRRSVRKLTKADGATFVLREGDNCYYAEEDALSPLWKGQRFPMQICISGWVMLNRQSAIIQDIYADARIPADAYRPTFVKSLAMIPIRHDAPIGALGIYWANKYQPTSQEINILQTLANSIAIAIENVQLYSTLENHIQELKTANKAKDEFLLLLSHELRTPLNAIVGWSEILRDGSNDPSEMHEGLEVIHRNAQVQTRIINDLLDATAIVSGKLSLEKTALDMHHIIRAAILSVRPLADTKKIDLIYKANQSFGMIMGDAGRLQQVLWNLLSNAIKFSPNSGQIKINTRREGPMLCTEVRDNGQGIDSQFIPHIFGRFSQADSSIVRKQGGLGLGLSIVHHLVEAHGGRVEVESDGIGFGASFKVFLPLMTIETTNVQVGNTDEGPLKDKLILIIDDDEDVRRLVQVVLKRHGSQVLMAENTVEAEKIILLRKPHLLVCDISMPDEDGCTFMRRLRELGKTIPALALTAFADLEHERQANIAGFSAFLAKPFQPAKLLEIIIQLLKN